MMKYYAQFNSHRDLIDIDSSQIELDEFNSDDVLNIEVPKELFLEYKDFPEKYIAGHVEENEEEWYPVLDPNFEEKEKDKKKSRIQLLSMTRSDFFDGTIRAFGLDEDDLLIAIKSVLNDLPISELEKKISINNYKNALNFYRKHPLFTLLSSIEIPINENVTICISSDQWDKFFEETDKKNSEAYKELLPLEE